MSPDRAKSIAENKLHLKCTGFGYEYEGDYYLEMAPKDYDPNNDGAISDSCYKVDSVTAKVTPYSPALGDPQDFRKMHFFN